MKSPFPGMDPFLEEYWGDVHTRLATYATDDLQRQLPGDLIACVEENVAVQSKDPEEYRLQSYYADVRVEQVPGGSAGQSESLGIIAISDSIDIPRKSEPRTQRSIRIIEPHSGNRVVTAIEILGPEHKIGVGGRKAYGRKRTEVLRGGISLVEIDLIRAGRPNLAVATNFIPASYRQHYRVCVVRAWRRQIAQFYGVSLRKRLPVVSIPLRKSDKEASLDLQALIDMVYENGRYYRRDYQRELEPQLGKEDAAWAEQLLRETGF